MGTNISKPSKHTASSNDSACIGGMNDFHFYPNGPARMGGVHPRKHKAKKNASSGQVTQLSNLHPEAILIGNRNQSTQYMPRLLEADTNLDNHSEPPPPYSR